MIKKITIFALLLSFSSFSQELVGSIPLELKKGTDVFQIVNETTKQTTFFLSDNKKVKAIRLNEKMQVVDTMSVPRPNSKYSKMIGTCGDKSNPMLFWASSNDKEILTQKFKFLEHKTSEQKYDLTFIGEKVVEEFSLNGNFYIISVIKNTNSLKFYVFNETEKTEKTIDLNGFNFLDSDIKRTTFYNVLLENFYGKQESGSIEKITSDSPISLALSYKKRKVYLENNKLTFTFDNNSLYTQLIMVDLKTFIVKEKMIKKPDLMKDPSAEVNELESNSFLHQDKLFQIKSSPNLIKFSIKDLDDKILYENTIHKEKPIDFSNSEVFLENGSSKNKKTIENSKFIRKVNNQSPAISCYKQDDTILVTIGSVSQVQQQMSNKMMVGAMFGVAGVLLASALSSPTMENFNAYANREVTYVNCLFNQTGEHITGSVKPLAFEKIRIYLENNPTVSSQTIFKLENDYYLGSFLKNEYSFRKFVN
ncbi:hypothetical protein [Flavobacterium sp.]|uniref:hypothetical protein n=1 Tax=Flavobacterium sp. TaxID=239 RepID=UPI00286E2506|nr:hypothetical protein [Flavobacterium sp.]